MIAVGLRPGGTESAATIGIDIGGTSVRASVVAPDGSIVASARASTPGTVGRTEDVVAGLVDGLRAEHEVTAVGLAVAGFIS
ncbi:MAG TPA: ROK family protein, partial [Nakamurella sp.]